MPDQESARDERLAGLLEEALATLRQTGTLDVAAWQTHHPDLADDLPALLETLRHLDTAVGDWKALAQPATLSVPAGAPRRLDRPLPQAVGRYEILAVLGEGGMGTVYKARDPQLRRLVAVKVPRFDGPQTARAVAVQRFLREAHAAAGVRHPNVCPIHDVGEQDGLPFVVMDYVEGRSLAERLEAGHFEDCRAAAALVRQVADALEAVHERGLIHRDLKPGNILLDTGGRALLTDFGLARPQQTAEALTAAGELVGTPAYMAPEQVRPDVGAVGPWTDVYSLGVVLYQMLCGRLPFYGSVEGVLYQIAHATPAPPSQFREDLDPALGRVVLRMLAKQPEARFRTAREVVEALDRWSAGLPVPAAEPPTTAEPRPAAAGSPTVIRSDLPEGGSLTVTLQPGAAPPEKLNVTVRERTGKKRCGRRVVTISITVAFGLLIAVGVLTTLTVEQALHTAGTHAPSPPAAEEHGMAVKEDPREAEEKRLAAEERRRREEERQRREDVRVAVGATVAYNGLAPRGVSAAADATQPQFFKVVLSDTSRTGPYYAGSGHGTPGSLPAAAVRSTAYPLPDYAFASSGGSGNPYDSSHFYAGYIRGAGDVTSAASTVTLAPQQSDLSNQQVAVAKLEGRRALWDEWLYERYNMPALQDERQSALALITSRALTEPPKTEILQATTLNRLLGSVIGKTNGPSIPLDANILQQINVTDPAVGNLGVLKPSRDGSPLSWPSCLKAGPYQPEVRQVDEQVVALVKEAVSGAEVDAVRLRQLAPAITGLKTKVEENQQDLTVVQMVEARRFLNQLDTARKAMGNPRAAGLLAGKLVPRGKTVGELVQHMKRDGLVFAPAMAGEEQAYLALYDALRAYAVSAGTGKP
jgi:tRNA A-37 threonylcarbamoyl transferase component Bud32